jgi:hypothetical protein
VTELALEQPVTGLSYTNFFNGRRLTGEDLAAEQAAVRAALARLGRVHEPGVVGGLEVRLLDPAAPSVRIEAGLAVDAHGRVLELAEPVTLRLRRPVRRRLVRGRAVFDDCAPPVVPFARGPELQLLVLRAGEPQARGRAAVNGLGNEPAPCAVDRLAESVSLRLAPFTIDPLPPLRPRLRSRVAHLLLGGLLDDLVGRCLAEDDVPLALLHWPRGGEVAFCDMWAARREPRGRDARREQFQQHLRDVASPSLVALEELVALPPLCSIAGVDPDVFLRGLTVRRESWVEGARVGWLEQAAGAHPPVELDRTPPEALWRHRVAGRPDELLLVSGHVPWRASAQLDLAHLDQATYAVPTT